MTIEQIEPRVTLSLDSRIGQSTLLFGSMIVAMGLTFVTSVMTTRFLGPSAYGDLKFIQTFWALLALISTFGLLYSGSRVLLLEDDRGNSREVMGATLFIALIIGLFIAFISASGAKIIDGIFGTQISQTLIMLAPLTLALPLRTSLLLILQSENRITWISFIYIMPPILFLVGLFLIWILTKPNTGNVLFVRMVTELMILGFIVVLLKPKFGSFSKWWHVIRAQNKTYGRPVYSGAMANVATAHINRLGIAYWVDNTSLGFYSLAASLVEPLKLLPNAVATSSFKDFSGARNINRRLFLATIALSFLVFAFAYILFGEPLKWVYTEEFATAGVMARILGIGAVLHGLGDFVNRFLGAHGRGRSLRNVAFIVGAINVLGLILVLPIWGVEGALAVTVLSGVSYFIFMFISYYRYTHNLVQLHSTADMEVEFKSN